MTVAPSPRQWRPERSSGHGKRQACSRLLFLEGTRTRRLRRRKREAAGQRKAAADKALVARKQCAPPSLARATFPVSVLLVSHLRWII